jgi:hypothetical protein
MTGALPRCQMVRAVYSLSHEDGNSTCSTDNITVIVFENMTVYEDVTFLELKCLMIKTP